MTANGPPARWQWLARRDLFRVGRFRASTYAVMLYIGFVSGVVVAALIFPLDATRFASAALVLLAFALVGGRVWYIVQHPRWFMANPSEVWRIQDGGAGLYGGLVLSFIASWPVLRVAGLDLWRFWDGAAVVLLVGMIITRFGCLMTGCCAGRETRGPFGMWLPDHTGEWQRRYPAQLCEAAWCAVILGVGVWLYTPSGPAGVLFFGSAAAYGLGRLGLELVRADAATTALPTRMNLAFSALLALASFVAFMVRVA